jgi:DNA topoisomerase-1
MQPALYDTVSADINAADYLFKATGSILKFDGFLRVHMDSKGDKEEKSEFEDVTLPELTEGQILKLKKLEPKQHFTEPPLRYSEATLVKVLEEKGIGRPSTYAPIISTILARGYIVRDKKSLIPTELGEKVTELLIEYFSSIVDVEFTANMEKLLDDVEEGEKNWVDIIRDFYLPFELVLQKAEEEIGKIKIEDEVSDVICEHCGRNLVFKQGKFGKFLACPGFPECRNIKPILILTGIKCPKCEGELVQRRSKRGKKFFGCSRYPECNFVSWDEPVKENCPECSTSLAKKTSKAGTVYKCLNEECSYQKITDK